MDSLIRLTLTEDGKEFVVNTSDIAYVVEENPPIGAMIAVRPKIDRYLVFESFDYIVSASCKPFVEFTNYENKKKTAIAKSFVTLSKPNLLATADIFAKEPMVRFITEESWSEISSRLIDCGGLPPEVNEKTFREEFVSIENLIKVTVNNGLIPSDKTKVYLYQNGQLISTEYYSVSGDEIFLNYNGDREDIFTVVFVASSPIPIEKSFREEVTGVTSVITATVNNGVIPTEKDKIYVYQNGQLISPEYYNVFDNQIFLTYTSDVSDKFTIVFGKILTSLKEEEQIFREEFTNIANVLSVTVNNGFIPADKGKVYVYQNGQLISPQFYSINGNEIVLNYNATIYDKFTVIFGEVVNNFSVSRMYKQEFTNITNTITVTVNNGILPLNLDKVLIYQNGQLIGSSYYSILGNVITLSYSAETSDLITVIFYT